MNATALSAPAAFRGLYDEHHAFVWGVLRKLGVPERDAEDVMQEVFLVVHRRIDAFEGRSTWTTWLYGISTRVYWNYARRRRARPEASASGSSLRVVDPGPDPERFTQQREASAMLEALLGSLDADKRTVYVLNALEGLSAPEISAITGVNTRTIYSRLRAAKAEIEASACRIKARARNDDAVRRLAARSTSEPPRGLRARCWAGLTLGAPQLAVAGGTAAGSTGLVAALPWLVALGAVTVGAAWLTGGTPDPADTDIQTLASPIVSFPSAAAVGPAVQGRVAPPRFSTVAASVPDPPPLQQHRARRVAPTLLQRTPPPAFASDGSSPRPETLESSSLGELPRARLELKVGRPQAALDRLRAHARLHPDSALAAERASMMLLALCALDRVEDATALAATVSVALPASCVRVPSG